VGFVEQWPKFGEPVDVEPDPVAVGATESQEPVPNFGLQLRLSLHSANAIYGSVTRARAKTTMEVYARSSNQPTTKPPASSNRRFAEAFSGRVQVDQHVTQT
jgi:hypothetical protein